MSVGPVIYKSEFIKDFYQRVIQDSGTFEGKLSSYTSILDELALSGNVYDFLCVPNAYKTSKIYSIFPNNTDNDLTFSRSTSATKVNKNGIVEVVGNNEPRIDYSISSTPVILSEESKSNLILSSENYDTINWNNNGAILDPQTVDVVDIYETNLATKVTGSNTNTLSQDIIIPADDTSYTASIFVKKGDSENITLALDLSNGTALNFEVNYNFSTSNLSSIGTDTPDDFMSFKLKNGWIRISITCTNNSTNDKGAFTIKPNNDSTSSKFSYFIGAQLEEEDLTSYIPSSIGNRGEDIIETDYNSNLTVDIGEDQMISNFSSTQLPKGRILSIKGSNEPISNRESNFILLVDTTSTQNPSGTQFRLNGAEGEYDINAYKDNVLIQSYDNLQGDETITLPESGIFEIEVVPKEVNGFNRLRFATDSNNKKGRVLEVINWGYVQWSSMESMFSFCRDLTDISKAGSIKSKVIGEQSGKCFSNLPLLKSVEATDFSRMFFRCDLTTIPENLFSLCTEMTDVSSCFGSNNIDSIGSDLFKNCRKLVNVNGVFSSNSITTIPENLFSNNTLIESMVTTFAFNDINDVPEGFLDNNTLITNITDIFYANEISSIPSGLLSNLTNLDFAFAAFADNNITSIPSGFFDNNTLLTDIGSFFAANNITSIPPGILDNNVNLTSVNRTFGFNNINEIPSGIFDNNILLTDVSGVFQLNNISTIPSGIFDNLPQIINASYIFGNNNISIIPSGIFDNNTNLIRLEYAFSDNNISEIPVGIFINNGNLSNLSNCFSINGTINSVPSDTFNDLNLQEGSTSGLSEVFDQTLIPKEDYTNLLIELDINYTNNTEQIYFGAFNNKYDFPGVNPRRNLIENKQWVITDGGLDDNNFKELYVNNVFLEDFDSVNKAFNVFTNTYRTSGNPSANPNLREEDIKSISTTPTPTATYPNLCKVVIEANENLISPSWSSFILPSDTGMFHKYEDTQNKPSIDYIIDDFGIIENLPGRDLSQQGRLMFVKLEGVTSAGSQSLGWHTSPPRVMEFPNLVTINVINNGLFNNWRNTLDYLYIPELEVGDPTYDNYFNNWGIRANGGMKKIIYINPQWETANGGNLHESLQLVLSNEPNTDIRYVTNKDAPNEVNNLSVSNITSTNVQLNFTEPQVVTNVNDFYEVWINDGTNNLIQNYFPLGEVSTTGENIDFRLSFGSDGSIEASIANGVSTGLVPNTDYTIKIRTVDFLYNKSTFSNEVSFRTLAS
jgi:hypothetical protein